LSYINVGLGLLAISYGLFLFALNSRNNHYGFIIVGIVINFIGAAVLFTGAVKVAIQDN